MHSTITLPVFGCEYPSSQTPSMANFGRMQNGWYVQFARFQPWKHWYQWNIQTDTTNALLDVTITGHDILVWYPANILSEHMLFTLCVCGTCKHEGGTYWCNTNISTPYNLAHFAGKSHSDSGALRNAVWWREFFIWIQTVFPNNSSKHRSPKSLLNLQCTCIYICMRTMNLP